MIFLIVPCVILVNVVFFFCGAHGILKKLHRNCRPFCPHQSVLNETLVLPVSFCDGVCRKTTFRKLIGEICHLRLPCGFSFFVSFKEVMFVVLLTKTLKPNKWIFFHTRHLRRNVLFLRRLHSLQCNPANCLSTCSESSSAHTAVY